MYLPCDKTLRVAGNRHILILAWGRVLEFAEAARPPMKAGRRADEVASGLQRDTACRLGILQVLEGGEVLVGQCRVGQGPQVLGRVELRRVGRQEEQMDVLGDPQLDARMPAGAIEDQHDLLLRPRPHCLREGGQLGLEEGDVDRRREVEDGAPRRRVHEGDQVAPFIAMLDRRQWPLTGEAPDLLQDGLEPDAVFVVGPDLDGGFGEGGRDLADKRSKPPLKASCSPASARTWRGRGCNGFRPSRRRYDQPVQYGTGRPSLRLSHSATVRPVQSSPSGAGPASAWRSSSCSAAGTKGRPVAV